MFKGKIFSFLMLLVTILSACKNDQQAPVAAAEQSAAPATPAPAAINVSKESEGHVSYVAKDKITLRDGKEITLPSETDKSTSTLYFATPATTIPGKTSLSPEGQGHAARLASSLSQAGIVQAYVSGNAAMQMALGTVKDNKSELNIFKAEEAETILKTALANFGGKKVMIVADAPLLADMIGKLTGKAVPAVSATQNSDLFVAIAKAMGSAELHIVAY